MSIDVSKSILQEEMAESTTKKRFIGREVVEEEEASGSGTLEENFDELFE